MHRISISKSLALCGTALSWSQRGIGVQARCQVNLKAYYEVKTGHQGEGDDCKVGQLIDQRFPYLVFFT